jgi:hypothetical protein
MTVLEEQQHGWFNCCCSLGVCHNAAELKRKEKTSLIGKNSCVQIAEVVHGEILG